MLDIPFGTCSICGRELGDCDKEAKDAGNFTVLGWTTEDGRFTHQIYADTPIKLTFTAVVPKSVRIRVINA